MGIVCGFYLASIFLKIDGWIFYEVLKGFVWHLMLWNEWF
jgi:hypothetical protein